MSALMELRRRWWVVVLAVAVLVLLFGTRVASFYTDVLWYDSIGFSEVFWSLLGTRVALGVVSGVVMTLLLGANILLAKRLSPVYRLPSAQEANIERYRQAVAPFARPLLVAVALVVGLLAGLSLVGAWPVYLQWSHAQEFGRVDPQFGRDLGFFVFVLPFHSMVNSWLFSALLLTTVLTALTYYVFGGIRPQAPGTKVTPPVSVHLSVLLAALVGVRAWGFWLNRYQLSYSQRGQVTGLSYTDVHAQLIAYQLLTVIAAVCVLLFLVNVRFRGWLLPSAGVGILLVASVVLSGLYPAVIQRLQVEPQELEREAPYIERNIELTRFAYGLDEVEVREFPAETQLSAEQVAANRSVLESVRLWDPATLQAVYQQLQTFRPYYDFVDVDPDRYPIEGVIRQVMFSVREVNETRIPEPARTWQNQHLVYTHGYGFVSSSVSGSTGQGQPLFVAQNIPLDARPGLEVEQPRIYFGEDPPSYSIVRTEAAELDYPLEGSGFQTFEYDGADGVTVGSPLRQLAFALRFGDPNVLLSGLLRADSQVLLNRRVQDRVRLVAPYLKLDHDPYAAAVDGRVKWIVDAYTTSDMVPYSERVELGALTVADQRVFEFVQEGGGEPVLRERLRQLPGIRGRANYIRNSVKAVVDAYDGTVELYVVEPEDPIIRAWMETFPDSFRPLSEASPELLRHFRYPEDLFRVQTALYRTYHMLDSPAFYSKEDAWRIPNDASHIANRGGSATDEDRARQQRPFYLLLRLPGEENEEFTLVQTFTPTGERRNNLVAWMVGRADPGTYGGLRAYTVPQGQTVFGPEQVQARIDQDSDVSAQITLWNTAGSEVIRGNLLVVPVEQALLYVQPLFLQANQSSIPELKKVVIVFGDAVVMQDTLAGALGTLFGADTGALGPPGEGPTGEPGFGPPGSGEPGAGAGGLDPRLGELIGQALGRFAEAEQALRDGDLGLYQQRTREAQQLLEQAQRLVGAAPAPALAPVPAPATPSA